MTLARNITRALLTAGVLAAFAAPLAPADARPTRAGKVERVERPRAASSKRIILCYLEMQDRPAICLGKPPAPGEIGSWLDYQQVVGRVRAGNSQPHPADLCGLGQIHSTEFELLTTPPSGATLGFGIILFNLTLDSSRSRLHPSPTAQAPSGNPEEHVVFGVDTDGNDDDDLLVTSYPCDPANAPPRSSHSLTGAQCFGYWRRDRGQWTRTQEEVFYQCR